MNEMPQRITSTFAFVSDPGHGWLVVPKNFIAQAGLTEADFTPYSYQKGAQVALEEDCDMGTFLNVWTEKFGKPELNERHEDPTEIRKWAGYGTKASTW